MSTVIVVDYKGMLPTEARRGLRKMLMKDLEEGLILKDETFELSVINTVGEVGIEFNKEGIWFARI